MKKAKLILAGIACMAVVGGAFAFKASKFAIPKLYVTTTLPAGCVTTTYNSIQGDLTTAPVPVYTTKNGTICLGRFTGQVFTTTNL